MPTCGLELFNAAGASRLRVTDRLTRVLYQATVASGVSGSVNLPDFVPAKGVVVSQSVADSAHARVHKTSVSGSIVSWSGTDGGGNPLGPSLIVVLMYA
ncbi:MAG: hypothetical protein ACOY5C_02845 [Pseudomonadota bacterium]